MTTPLIVAEGLTKRFGDHAAVQDVSLSVGPGEFVGLLGANGAGKTTTIHMLLGLVTPTSGTIHAFGQDIARERHRRAMLARVNFSSAYVTMPSNLTGRENLTVFANLYNVKDVKARIARLADELELTGSLDKQTGALSSGQLTRLNLCKALLNDPELLFLDEPTASLDPDSAERTRALLQKIQRERSLAILYTSHNMREIELLCPRVIFLAGGKIIAQGAPAQLTQQSGAADLESFFIQLARGHNA
jgi:ABC-2 type transport system ATP-binding protein